MCLKFLNFYAEVQLLSLPDKKQKCVIQFLSIQKGRGPVDNREPRIANKSVAICEDTNEPSKGLSLIHI